MAIDLTKVFFGPFNMVITGGAGFTVNGLKEDAVAVNIESKRGSRELEDGDEKHWLTGRLGNIEVTIDELSTTDAALIEAGTSVAFTFTEQSDVITMAIEKAFVDIENGRTKITFIKAAGVGSALSDIITIT